MYNCKSLSLTYVDLLWGCEVWNMELHSWGGRGRRWSWKEALTMPRKQTAIKSLVELNSLTQMGIKASNPIVQLLFLFFAPSSLSFQFSHVFPLIGPFWFETDWRLCFHCEPCESDIDVGCHLFLLWDGYVDLISWCGISDQCNMQHSFSFFFFPAVGNLYLLF